MFSGAQGRWEQGRGTGPSLWAFGRKVLFHSAVKRHRRQPSRANAWGHFSTEVAMQFKMEFAVLVNVMESLLPVRSRRD